MAALGLCQCCDMGAMAQGDEPSHPAGTLGERGSPQGPSTSHRIDYPPNCELGLPVAVTYLPTLIGVSDVD